MIGLNAPFLAVFGWLHSLLHENKLSYASPISHSQASIIRNAKAEGLEDLTAHDQELKDAPSAIDSRNRKLGVTTHST